MEKQVFIINGCGGVGKDTFVSYVRQKYPYMVLNFSSVDKVKQIAKIIGWDGRKSERDRKFLSDLKCLCTGYNDMPFNSMASAVNEFAESEAEILFLHIREPEEIARAQAAFHAKTILVKRDLVKQIISNDADKNVSNYPYDIVVNNDGDLKSFRRKAEKFVLDFCAGAVKPNY